MARVLVGTDGSDAAIHAAKRAMALLGDVDRVAVVMVVETPPVLGSAAGGLAGPIAPGDPAVIAELDEAATAEAGTAVRRTIEALGDGARDAEAIVVHGAPGPTLCALAEERGDDVVVVGSHGSGFLKRVLVGSVSHHVVQHAGTAVLVVRAERD